MFVYIFVVAVLVYICICGPTRYHRDGIVGTLYLLLINGPSVLVHCLCTVLCCSKDRGSHYGANVEHYCCERRNPLIQSLYVILMAVSVYIWYQQVYPMIPRDTIHIWTGPMCTAFTIGTFIVACASDPGRRLSPPCGPLARHAPASLCPSRIPLIFYGCA